MNKKIFKNISLAEDTISQSELDNLGEWVKTNRRLTKGPLCIDFENEFAKWQGAKYSIFVNSGSSANLLMIYSLMEGGYLRNNTVIAPSVSWVTTVSPLMQLGFDVRLCDCDSKNLGLDVNHFEKLCQENRPSLVVLVHVLGHANNLKAILEICRKYDVILLEDSCEALGSVYDSKKLGSWGKAGSFSFYYGHHISTIEGGMVVTDDEYLYNLMLSIRSHGWGRDVGSEHHALWKSEYHIDEVRDLYTFYHPGFNLRSTDLNAFLGLSQMRKVDKLCRKRTENHQVYSSLLEEFWTQRSETEFLSSFAYGVLVSNRIEVYNYLKTNGIETRPLICGNIGKHPFWIKKYGETSLKNADIVHDYGLYLPNHYNLSNTDIKFVCSKFQKVAKIL